MILSEPELISCENSFASTLFAEFPWEQEFDPVVQELINLAPVGFHRRLTGQFVAILRELKAQGLGAHLVRERLIAGKHLKPLVKHDEDHVLFLMGNSNSPLSLPADAAPILEKHHAQEALANAREVVARMEEKPELGITTNGTQLLVDLLDTNGKHVNGHDPREDGYPWPEPPRPEAFWGLSKLVVDTILPHTEADRTALLVNFLSSFACMAGPAAYVSVSGEKHTMKLWTALVGGTSSGRKGTSFGSIRYLLELADPSFCANNVKTGLNSGEGLIYAVRDPCFRTGEDGKEEIADPGVSDKRLLVVEPELCSIFKLSLRDGNNLNTTMRKAWDDGILATLIKTNANKSTGSHISVTGHITKEELTGHITSTDIANGFANRFLWICVRRSKLLPSGGRLREVDFSQLVSHLATALNYARSRSEIRRSEKGEALWTELYTHVVEKAPEGTLGMLTARATAYLLRLSMTYAMLDCCPDIRPAHILAAKAVWDYSVASCRHIFNIGTGNPIADKILPGIVKAGDDGMSRTQIRDALGRNCPSRKIEDALKTLTKLDLAHMATMRRGTRPVEIWFPVR